MKDVDDGKEDVVDGKDGTEFPSSPAEEVTPQQQIQITQLFFLIRIMIPTSKETTIMLLMLR
jgi:hypothetical protein